MAGVVPRKVDDSFIPAIMEVRRAASLANEGRPPASAIYFGASRRGGGSRHDGIDLGVPVGTRIMAPADRAVIIGLCRDSPTGPGASIGNGLVLFVPDERQPYFLLLAHLSPRTFQHMKDSGLQLGSEINDRTELAVSGRSKAGRWPHVHITATTEFMQGGRTYRADEFLELYRRGELPKTNFPAIKPMVRYRNPKSLQGYLDPLALISEGRLRMSALGQAPRIASSERPLLVQR